jgi:hypothetical protein
MTTSAFDPVNDDLLIASRKEIVFIEDNVADIDTLIKGIGSGKEIVILDATRDGVHQIALALAGRSGIDALHIMSHGSEGALSLGTVLLDAGKLDAYKGDLQAIGQSMNAGADIMLYGCSVGAGTGASFVQQLAIATGADVAASNDITGAAALGGDWELEVTSGQVGTSVAVDAQTAALYQSVLSISPGKVEFGTNGNFGSGLDPADPASASTDVIYRINNNSSYQLKIDGAGAAVSSYSDPDSQVFAGVYTPESAITFSFVGGQVFTPQSIALSNWSTTYTDQTFLIKGYDAQNHQIGSTVTATLHTSDYTATDITLGALGGALVTTLKITSTTVGNTINYLMIDSITIGTVTPAPPKVSFVTSTTANGAYNIGDQIDIAVGFDSTVDVTGTPQLKLETGATDRVVNYVSGSGTSTLTFRYTVQAGDVSADLDYFNTSALALNGGTIKLHSGGTDADLTLPAPGGLASLGANKAIVVDGVVPTLAITSDKTALKAGDTATITFTFSEDPGATFAWNGSSGDVAVSGGTLSAISGSGLTRTAVFTPTASINSGAASISVAAGAYNDAAGNNNTVGSNGPAISYDTLRPTVTITSDQSTLKAGETAAITFTFSEDPGATFTWNGSVGDVSVNNGTLSAISGTGLIRTATFTPTANTNSGTGSVSVGMGSFADAAGNINTSAGASPSITYDTKAPTLTVTSDKPALKVGETATITFTFSEDPGASFGWDGSSGDVSVSGGTLSAISGSGLTRTATFTPTAGTDSSTATISVTGAGYADAAGNTGANANVSFTYDTLAPNNPSAPVLLAADDKGDSSSDGITNKGTLQFSGTADAGATVRLYDTDGATIVGSGSADGSGNWSFNATLASGTHTVKAVAFDAAGNASGIVTGPVVVVDTTPPTVAITSNASTLKAGDTATITFTFSEDPGASFSWDGSTGSITVSGGTLSAISGTGATRTATFTPAADTDAGSAHISVASAAYHDVAGNDGAASNNLAIGYDTLAPAAPGTPNLAAGDDSGASDTDDLTNDTTTSFSGSADNGATVRLYDGASEIGHATASGGAYTIPVSGLSEGSHTLTAVAYDAAGNASAASSALVVTVDRTPSTTTVAGATLSQDSGASATDMVTKVAAQTISGTLSANLAAGEQVMVSLDNGASWNPATTSAGSNAWALAATLAGSGTLKVKVVDAAGNDGAVYSHAYTLDTTAPAAPSTPDLDAGSDSGVSDTDNITGVTLPSFSGTADVGATVTLFDGGNEIGSVVATDGTWHITTGGAWAMNQRTHYITAVATDLAGNASGSSALEVQVFTNAPTTTVASMALSSDSGVAGDFVTNAASQTVSGTLSANLASGERVQVSLNGGASWTDAASAVGQSTWSLPVTLAAGSHDIQVRVIDAIDNFSAALTQAYTLDAVKPTVAITSDVAQLKAGDTATITFTFSEDPGTSFDFSDIVVGNGTLSALSGSGATRTAVFTPTAGVDGGTASIGIAAGAYHDLAGNDGLAGATPSLTFDTHAPAAPSAPDLDHGSDSGALDTDNLTSTASQLFTGTAEAGATVRLYDTDGTTEIGHATATGGTWNITATLLDGGHTVTAKAFDAAGNASVASNPLTVTIDSAKPAAMAAPALAAGSDSAALDDGLTKVARPTFKGNAEAYAQVTLYDGAAVLGTASANASGAWEFTPAANLADRAYVISARQVDLAGNQSDAGAVFNLTVDTVAPAAPAAPSLNAASDTDTRGDGVTENNLPVIEGTALANTLVTLYDIAASGKVTIGSAMADGAGKWSIATAGLSIGTHSLTATQSDAAGNESVHSAPFALRIDAPPVLVNLIDGVAVDIQPVSLPGSVLGSAVSIPIVGSGRLESSGRPGVADIPLATSSQGGSLLLAQVPAGVGLSASGANVTAASGAALLLAAIKAATPSHAATDQGHLTSNGQTFLAGLSSSGTLLVETVKPVSAPNAPDAVLTLSGPAQSPGHSTALVIDAGGMGAGATIALQDVSFAAVIGAANVTAAGGMILTGDAASQHFTVAAASGANAVLAGGGNDTLTLSQPSGGTGTAGAVTLHGGSANDVAVFSGARADYNLAFHNGYLTVTAKSGPAAAATVINVETLQFSDGSVAVQNSADMGTLAGIYQTVLGRQADVYGIEYWANVHQAGASWGAIALAIVGSAEKTSGHDGFNGGAAHDLTLLYTALFNRAPDAAGLAYWTDVMAHGVSLEQVATGFVQSVEMVGHQRGALDWEFTL